jgi:hypothetical protein
VKHSHASVQIILKEGQVISGKTIQELIGIY